MEHQIREIKQNPEILSEYSHRTIYHEFLKDPQNVPSDKILLDEAILFVSAGADTTSDAVTLALLNVLHNPSIHNRVREEIDGIWPQVEQCPPYEVLEKLPYLVCRFETGVCRLVVLLFDHRLPFSRSLSD